jgi:NTP pyrophosphatase (non-canonical NTP hydrolase)
MSTVAGFDSVNLSVGELQRRIDRMYGSKDTRRGPEATFLWFMQEVGELATDLRIAAAERTSYDVESKKWSAESSSTESSNETADSKIPSKERQIRLEREFADVLAWLATLANVMNVNLTAAFLDKYGSGCPGCGADVCRCSDGEKP